MSQVAFKGRKLVVATMHKKEEVIAPLLEKELGVSIVAATDLGVDAFGTYDLELPPQGASVFDHNQSLPAGRKSSFKTTTTQ